MITPTETTRNATSTQTPVNNTILVAVIVALLAGLLPINLLAEMTSIGTLRGFTLWKNSGSIPSRRWRTKCGEKVTGTSWPGCSPPAPLSPSSA
jgi:amino acid transporter